MDEDNPALASLAGLNPTTIGGRLRIRCQTGIVDIDAFSATRFIRGDIELARNPALAGLTGLGGPDGDLTTMGDASALRVLACENGPLNEADFLQILVSVAQEVPFDFQAMGCP